MILTEKMVGIHLLSLLFLFCNSIEFQVYSQLLFTLEEQIHTEIHKKILQITTKDVS